MAGPEDPNEMLSIDQVAAELNRNPATVWRWLKNEELKGRQIGRRTWVVLRSDLKKFLETPRPKPGPKPRPPQP